MADLSELRIVVTGDDADAQQKLSALRQTMTENNQEMTRAAEAGRQAQAAEQAIGSGAEQATGSVRQLKTEINDLRGRLAELNTLKTTLGPDAAAQLVEPIRQTEAEIARLEGQLRTVGSSGQQAAQQMNRSFVESASSVAQLRQHLEALQQVQKTGAAQGIFTPGLAQEIGRTEAAIKSVTQATEQQGSAFGAAAVRVAQYAVAYEGLRVAKQITEDLAGASIGLQTELVKTAALTDVSSSQIGAFGQAITKLSADVGRSGKELGAAFYFVASSGIASSEAMNVLEVSAKASAAGLGETKTVADAVTSTLNAYQLSGSQAGRVTDVLVTAVKEGKGEASEFAASLGRVLPVAAASGVSIEQVAASMAVMTRGGLSAQEAATALRGTLGELEKPGAAARKELAELGLSADSVRQSIRDRGLLTTLEDLIARTDGNIDSLGVIIPNIRALTGVLSTAGSQADAYASVLDSMNNAQGATDRAFATTSQSVEFQGNRIKAAFEAIGNGIAADLLPNVATAAEQFANGLNPNTQKAVQNLDKVQPSAQQAGQGMRNTINAADALGMALAGAAQMGADLIGVLDHLSHSGSFVPGLDAQVQQAYIDAQRDALLRTPMDAGAGGKENDVRSRPVPFSYAQQYSNTPIPEPPESQAAQAQAFDYDAARQQAQGLAATSSEARKLHEIMVDLWKLPGDADPKIIEDKLKSLATAEAQQEQAWQKALNPEDGAQRVGRLAELTSQYSLAVVSGNAEVQQSTQAAIDAYLQQMGAADTATAAQKRQNEETARSAAEARRQQNEAAQAARAAREADPLVGIRESIEKDRDDLVGSAGRVMADLQNAVSLRGQAGARAAGEAFGNEARKWGEELQKAGAPGWEDAFHQLLALGETAVVTGSADVTRAIHDMLLQGEQEIRQAGIDKAMGEAMAKATLTVQEAQNQFDNQMASAAASAADAQATALQTELDREYDVWATHEVDTRLLIDQQGREQARVRERWAQEDVDREEQHTRALNDLQTRQGREAIDRAEQQARSLLDAQLSQTRSVQDTNRARLREDADAEYAHQQAMAQITKGGGADAGKRLADENDSYQQQLSDRARKRQEDDAESAVKRQEQMADAQRRAYEQNADAVRKATEARADLAQREGEQGADTAKARARQEAERTQQDNDQRFLRDQRLAYEQTYHVDAESKAHQRYLNELLRIDATEQHRVDAAAGALAQVQAKTEHDKALAAIQADRQPGPGQISEDEASRRTNAENERFTQQTASIQSALREQETSVDRALRDAISATSQTAGGYRGANTPAVPAPLAFPQLSFPAATSSEPSFTGPGSSPGGVTINGPVTINVDGSDSPDETARAVYRTLLGMGTRASTTGAVPAIG